MLDMYVVLISGCIPLVLGSILGYFALKRLRIEAISIIGEIIDGEKALIKDEVEKWLNSEAGVKALHSIGSIIGNGAISGAGIPKTSGKFKWQNLIGDIASQFITGKLKLPASVGSTQNLKAENTTLIPQAK